VTPLSSVRPDDEPCFSSTRGGLRIALCFDSKEEHLAAGRSALEVMELDDESTIAGIEGGLAALGHVVERVGGGIELARRLLLGERWDLVFNIAEGLTGRGREAQVPAVCELLGQPYTFSDPVTCGVSLDKAWAKRIARDSGLATAPFVVVCRASDLESAELAALEPPFFVKPLAEGSSKGVTATSLVPTRDQLAERCRLMLPDFPDGLLVETYLAGREVTVGVVGTGPEARVIGVMEVCTTRRGEACAYTALNKGEYEQRVRYRLLSRGHLAREARRTALDTYRALACRDAARVDLRCNASGQLQLLEVNPLPGLNPIRSDLPIMARLAGIGYPALLGWIIGSALARTVVPISRRVA
jgi:D-alanine-D-alanine ligase